MIDSNNNNIAKKDGKNAFFHKYVPDMYINMFPPIPVHFEQVDTPTAGPGMGMLSVAYNSVHR